MSVVPFVIAWLQLAGDLMLPLTLPLLLRTFLPSSSSSSSVFFFCRAPHFLSPSNDGNASNPPPPPPSDGNAPEGKASKPPALPKSAPSSPKPPEASSPKAYCRGGEEEENAYHVRHRSSFHNKHACTPVCLRTLHPHSRKHLCHRKRSPQRRHHRKSRSPQLQGWWHRGQLGRHRRQLVPAPMQVGVRVRAQEQVREQELV